MMDSSLKASCSRTYSNRPRRATSVDLPVSSSAAVVSSGFTYSRRPVSQPACQTSLIPVRVSSPAGIASCAFKSKSSTEVARNRILDKYRKVPSKLPVPSKRDWICGMCSTTFGSVNSVKCDGECDRWFHQGCVGITSSHFARLHSDKDLEWKCSDCSSSTGHSLISNAIQAIRRETPSAATLVVEEDEDDELYLDPDVLPLPDVAWENMLNAGDIKTKLDSAYLDIVKWNKNFFVLPRGKVGKDFLFELTRLIKLFTCDSAWKPLALKLVHVFIPLMLQRPSVKSKASDNARYLRERLTHWENGEICKLVSQGKEIQDRLVKTFKKNSADNRKAFCRLMFEGKVSKALRFIDNDEDATTGALPCSPEVLESLKEKHPDSRGADPEVLIPVSADPPDPVIFEGIDSDAIIHCARAVSGSGGPTKVDADVWRHLICSRFFGNHSSELASAIADLAKILCREVIHSDCTQELLAGRLIPLQKRGGGVRPIGVGEVLRRIIAKSVSTILIKDIQLAAGTLQTCSGIEAGIEAATHSMRKTFQKDSSECMLLVDASNAFNNLNRIVALHNVREICPSFHRFLDNSYKSPAKLFVADSGSFIFSKEGVTQGDPVAMAMYSVSTSPFIRTLSNVLDEDEVQAWFADDSAACGYLNSIKKWWETICRLGPKYGYFPNPTKTVLIVKDPENLQRAKDLFQDVGITVTAEGDRHLGAAIGTQEFKENYVKKKVESWCRDVDELSQIAVEDPQVAYSAYTKGLAHRWKFVQRTISDIGHIFEPLESKIKQLFIPNLIGRQISDKERALFALPLRFGGLGIQDPMQTADKEFEASVLLTEELSDLILKQDHDLTKLQRGSVIEKKKNLKLKKELEYFRTFADIKSQFSEEQQKFLVLAKEKGSYVWLSALPLQRLGYVLNKEGFRDAIRLRYNWPIPNVPRQCACGVKNNNDHLLMCKKGGYIHIRHDALVQTEAELMREAGCKDVRTEQFLIPTQGDHLRRGTEKGDQARMDVAATGVYGRLERTFFDVRVTYPNAPSNKHMTLNQLYKQHEREKKAKYEERILEVEKGSFCPLVYSTTGGMGDMCASLHKRIARLISEKRKEDYSSTIRYMRTRLRFVLLRSVLMCLRGIRGRSYGPETNISDVSFGLIPEVRSYEV